MLEYTCSHICDCDVILLVLNRGHKDLEVQQDRQVDGERRFEMLGSSSVIFV